MAVRSPTTPPWPSPFSLPLSRHRLPLTHQMPGFISPHALLHAAETRTSCPVRVERGAESYESVSLPGLYPIGEGAGYAGGIVSAAVDGMLAARAILRTAVNSEVTEK
ncbi:unnamed protein product [Closterium sp. NIES-54]